MRTSWYRALLAAAAAILAGGVLASSSAGAARPSTEGPGAIRDLAGCTTNTFPGNDDGSTALTPIGFTASFYGVDFSDVYINNNGNVMLNRAMSSFTPYDFTLQTDQIIAPYFGDVDTRAGNPVTYGTTTVGGRPAFCVDWVDVGYYREHTDKLNSFQLLLVDRSDTGTGNFDIEFNYDRVEWETGDASGGVSGFGGVPARAGFTSGDGDPAHSEVLNGSGVSMSFEDSNATTGLIHNSIGSGQLGRYYFPIRNVPPTGSTLQGTVDDPSSSPIAGAPVQLCTAADTCPYVRQSDANGEFAFHNLPAGDYTIVAGPPAGSSYTPGTAGPVAVTGELPPTGVFTQDVTLGAAPGAPPDGTSVGSQVGTTSSGVPIVYWNDPLSLETHGCVNGTATYEVAVGGTVVRQGPMPETPAGSGDYIATGIEPLYPNHGDAQVSMTITCPDTSQTTVDFGIYIDPSGVVTDAATGQPIAGATVTLLRSDAIDGPFVPVPNGSAIMSPTNRSNPSTTAGDGSFGWDVIAGYYEVTAEADGCTEATTDVLTIPPPVTNLNIALDCGSAPGPQLTVTLAGTGTGWITSDPEGFNCVDGTCTTGYPADTAVTLTAHAHAGYVFAGWSGDCTGTGDCALSMTADKTVTATFSPPSPHTVTVHLAGTGTGTVTSDPAGISCGSTCSHSFENGTEVTLTPAPSSNSTFTGWTGACTGTGACQVTTSANRDVTATFTLKPPPAKKQCVVPNVKGKTLTAAKAAIKHGHCAVGKIRHAHSNKVKTGRVISQSPAAKKHLKNGAKVNLVISSGKARHH